jgi:Xylose isomerase-like TIM barrel.
MKPYRLGATSYLKPAGYTENLNFLAGKVDDVALLFFEPLKKEDSLDWIQTALQLKAKHGLSYSVHLPVEGKLASVDPVARACAVQDCVEVIESLSDLDPFAYVCHAEGECPEVLKADNLVALEASLCELGAACGDPRRICVENVDLPHATMRDALQAAGVSICYDVGHALQRGQSVLDELEQWLPECRVLHLHGVRNGRDHQSLDTLPGELFRGILELFTRETAHSGRILTLELFDETRWARSMELMLGVAKDS